jgi:hypothetical protein
MLGAVCFLSRVWQPSGRIAPAVAAQPWGAVREEQERWRREVARRAELAAWVEVAGVEGPRAMVQAALTTTTTTTTTGARR